MGREIPFPTYQKKAKLLKWVSSDADNLEMTKNTYSYANCRTTLPLLVESFNIITIVTEKLYIWKKRDHVKNRLCACGDP